MSSNELPQRLHWLRGRVSSHVTGWKRNAGFLKSIAILASATALGHVISLVSMPVITRLYSPADFGLQAGLSSLFALLLVVAAGKYDQAIVLSEDDDDAINLAAVALLVSILICCALGLVVWTSSDLMARQVGVPKLAGYLWLLPWTLFAGSLAAIFTGWHLRRKAYPHVARQMLEFHSFQALAQVGFGLLHLAPLGLLLGELCGRAASIAIQARGMWNQTSPRLSAITFPGMWRQACAHSRFPFVAAPSALLNVLVIALPPFFLLRYYGETVAGLYFAGNRLAAAPITMLGSAVANVFYSELASHQHDLEGNRQRFNALTSQLTLMALGILPFLLSAPWWVGPLLGEQWAEAGVLMAVLAPLVLGRLIVSPLSQTYYVYGKQHVLLVLDAVRAGLIVAVFTLSHLANLSLTACLLTFSLGMAGLYVFHCLAIANILKNAAIPNLPFQLKTVSSAQGAGHG